MASDFFWSDLFLKFWAFAANNRKECALAILSMGLFLGIIRSVILIKNKGKESRKCNIIFFALCIPPGILLTATLMARVTFPLVIKSAPNTPYKEELRQKAMTVGDAVWVIKRDESGTPTSIDEHIIFAKKSDSILVDEALIDGVHSNNATLSISLGSYPLSDCYSDKEDAVAAICSALKEDK